MKLPLNTYTNLTEAIDTLAYLKVATLSEYGAFLATGTDKDILLPYAEQNDELQPDDEVLVYIYLDNNQRPCASMKIEKFLKKLPVEVILNQEVDLIIYDETDLGFKAVINKKNLGLLYKNEVFQKLYYADSLKGFVKKLRDDQRLDLILRAAGHKATDDIAIKLIELLKENNNFLDITDKTSPEVIHQKFNTSKKKFKIALGRLYKERVITVAEDGIRLVV
ncbi:MAG: GntR family transcriptional regulator [Bdellovibrionaceae bacterium]|nr:GntR family transcriptional regulator [Pseudobdellovibrionaceae bacterium]